MGSALVLTLQRGRGVATVVCQITHCMQTLGSINWAGCYGYMLATRRPQQLAFFKLLRCSLTIVLLMVYSRCYNSSDQSLGIWPACDHPQVILENFLLNSLDEASVYLATFLMLLLLLIEIGLKNEVENKSCVELKTISFPRCVPLDTQARAGGEV